MEISLHDENAMQNEWKNNYYSPRCQKGINIYF